MPVVVNDAMRKRLDPEYAGNATEKIDSTPKGDTIELEEGRPKVLEVPLHPHLAPIRRGPVVKGPHWARE